MRLSLRDLFPLEVTARDRWKNGRMIRSHYYAPYFNYSWYVLTCPHSHTHARTCPHSHIVDSVPSLTPTQPPLNHTRHGDINEKLLPLTGLRWNMGIDGGSRMCMYLELVLDKVRGLYNPCLTDTYVVCTCCVFICVVCVCEEILVCMSSLCSRSSLPHVYHPCSAPVSRDAVYRMFVPRHGEARDPRLPRHRQGKGICLFGCATSFKT